MLVLVVQTSRTTASSTVTRARAKSSSMVHCFATRKKCPDEARPNSGLCQLQVNEHDLKYQEQGVFVYKNKWLLVVGSAGELRELAPRAGNITGLTAVLLSPLVRAHASHIWQLKCAWVFKPLIFCYQNFLKLSQGPFGRDRVRTMPGPSRAPIMDSCRSH